MPTAKHEGLIELFRQQPALAAQLAEVLGIKLPVWQQARDASGDLPDLVPAQRLADAVVTLCGADGAAVLAIVVEVQLGRDREKRWSWPAYLANLRSRARCPVVLLVVCADQRTARWCGVPIELGPGSVVRPWVLGPQHVPVVTDPGQARESPQLAVLSAMAHGGRPGPQQRAVLEALLAAYGAVDVEHASLYHDVVQRALPAAARHHLESLMLDLRRTDIYQSDFARHYIDLGLAQGKASGEAEALLEVLAARAIEVPDDVRARITGCTDLEQLRTWIRRAVTAGSVHDLFR